MRSKDNSRKANWILWSLLLAPTCLLSGPSTLAATENQTKAKEFLADPNVATCTLTTTAISALSFPGNQLPSFIPRLQRQNKTEVKEGRITLAGRPFRILLGERPEQEFHLFDVEKEFGSYWWGSWSLHSYHKIDEQFYQFVLIENGAKVAARPYRGPLGTIQVGKGGRDLEKIAFMGSAHQKGSVSSPIGIVKERWPSAVAECKIPVGDYTAYLMQVTYDNLAIDISDNYHTDAQGRPRGPNRDIVYGMQVREDKPYVLDFSIDPVVVFDQPPANKTAFSRGDEIKFAAVLVDPKLDIMIRGLKDTAVEVEQELPDGRKYKQPKSLDPQVVIARANGEIVAEGVMPFG